MKSLSYLFIFIFLAIGFSSCARRAVVYRSAPMYYNTYPHGFYWGGFYYDPRFYHFAHRGSRVIIIDRRTNIQVATPRRNQVYVEAGGPSRQRVSTGNHSAPQQNVRTNRNAGQSRIQSTNRPGRNAWTQPGQQQNSPQPRVGGNSSGQQVNPRSIQQGRTQPGNPNVNTSPGRGRGTQAAPPPSQNHSVNTPNPKSRGRGTQSVAPPSNSGGGGSNQPSAPGRSGGSRRP